MTLEENNRQNWMEMTVLCNMMVNAHAHAAGLQLLKEDCFGDDRNRIIFRTLKTLDSSSSEKRFTQLVRRLDSLNLLEAAGGKGYVTCVYLFVPAGDIEDHIRLLNQPQKRAA